MPHRILVVDDDVPLTKTIVQILVSADYVPLVAYTAEDGIALARSKNPDLALLDVMVPTMGGWEMCRQIRTFSDMPIIFLTAMGNVENVVQGLEVGADDYIVKPFNPAEVLARIMALLRRITSQPQTTELFKFGDGDLIIDAPAHHVIVYGEEKELTNREFDLLMVLVRNAGKVVTTADLALQAWQFEDEQGVLNVKPYIHYLRKKLETDPAAPRWIQTIRGVGYRLVTE
ncbi:MAG: response regulator transcription factor [Anaerolineae bacterium]|nr:response regulator transcription factor [Anaerolineae bacterium]